MEKTFFMNAKKIIYAVFISLIFSLSVAADSPLTSTDFAAAYSDEPIVAAASKTNGLLTDKLLEYLTRSENPIDIKMAVINQLGWNIENKNNAAIYLQYILGKNKYSDEQKFLKKGNADDLLVLAYLKALDNYFNVDEAVKYAEIALKKTPKSRTFNLIAGLIKAQQAMEKNWCEVYQITDRIRKNGDLKNDMKTEAVLIIYKYMDIYQDDCATKK